MSDPRAPDASATLRRLVESIRDHAVFNHPAPAMEIVETHISIILLTGPYAYKFKKPLDLGFLDFSTLRKRKFYCEEELRLNRRLAPRHYLEVVPIAGSLAWPVPGGIGSVLEYAVRMVQFPREMELDRLARRAELEPALIDRLAEKVALFHEGAAIAAAGSRHGLPESIREPALANFRQLNAGPGWTAEERESLRQLEEWTRTRCGLLASRFEARQAQGRVRECHGDMHLGNMVLHDGEIVIFDCIEFSEDLRWIDVADEVAFLVMDLQYRAGAEPAWCFLNAWLEQGGDYGGVAVLYFYLVYRALVRAKIASIRLQQPDIAAQTRAMESASRSAHLDLARAYAGPRKAALIVTHGLSGSGKTSLTRALLGRLGAVRVRSDIERKRLHGLTAMQSSGSAMASGMYSDAATMATYERLAGLAAELLHCGQLVIVDAACLRREQRLKLQAVARGHDVRCVLLDLRASVPVLRQRLQARLARGGDASEADARVLDHQMATDEPLNPAELAAAIVIDADQPVDIEGLCRQIAAKLPP